MYFESAPNHAGSVLNPDKSYVLRFNVRTSNKDDDRFALSVWNLEIGKKENAREFSGAYLMNTCWDWERDFEAIEFTEK